MQLIKHYLYKNKINKYINIEYDVLLIQYIFFFILQKYLFYFIFKIK